MNYREQYNQILGQKNSVKKRLEEKELDYKHLEKTAHWAATAQEWLQKGALDVQEQIKFTIEPIVNLALSSVFEDPYEFHIKFDVKHNKTEARLILTKWGKEFHPLKDNGGGVVDIVSLALRIAMFKLKTPQLMDTMILDEPFSAISEEYKDNAYKMLKVICEEVGIQFIIVTHDNSLKEYADTMYRIIQKDKISKARKEL